MTEPRPPIDDEIVSAVLDGEATPAERALVEGSPEGRRRLAELRAVAVQVGEPVAPLSDATVDDLVGRVMAAARVGDGGSGPTPPVDDLGAARARRADRPRAARLARVAASVAAAAAVLLAVVGLATVAGRSNSSSDSASSGGADTSATAGLDDQSLAPSAESSGGSSGNGAPDVPDLGPRDDADALLADLGVLLATPPGFEHSSSGLDRARAPGAADTAATASACVAPVPSRPATEGWRLVATGSLPSGPVAVVTDGPPAPGAPALVLDGGTCAVIAEDAVPS